jgi:hypothetical protein
MTKPGREAADPRAVAAARNNAEWCDLVCRMHGAATAFNSDAWVTATRSPPAYPDAVTLRDSAAADELLGCIDTAAGCSVKDSFASLDLAGRGFHLLFEAEWIYRATATATNAVPGLHWSVATTAGEIEVWAAAHGGGAVFQPALLGDPTVAVLLATDRDGRLAAGAIGNRSRTVVGLSNLFTVSADIDQAWSGAAATLSTVFPDLPLVGYERGEDLGPAHRAGFVSVAPLRVWLRT